MNIKTRFCLILLCLSGGHVFSQLDSYNHKITLSGISEQWHTVVLNKLVFEQLESNFSDMRIYGITAANDTIEAPYILKISKEKSSERLIDFKPINHAKSKEGYYITYETSNSEAINQIRLDFRNPNFDWHVQLDGSENRKQWFTIIEDQRILSIKNNKTNYSFTDLDFTNSKYRYYRVGIKTSESPELRSSRIVRNELVPADYSSYSIKKQTTDNSSQKKQTVVDIDLGKRVPLSYLKILVADEIDYYRPVSISHKSDSVKTEKGWKYHYSNLSSGILSSLEKNEFRFQNKLVRHIRVTVQNQDNRPLHIKNMEAKGYVHELIVRLTEPATYYLAFGKADDRPPSYDIGMATTTIPEAITVLQMGKVQDISKNEEAITPPLFENKLWLWGIMGTVILVLGWFTVRMMQKS